MQLDAEALLQQAITGALLDRVKANFTGYNKPLDSLIEKSIQEHEPALRGLLSQSIASCVQDEEFREQIRSAVRTNLAKTLVQRFGGELEKQVNALKSDPATRARITVAIEEIVKQST